MNPWFPIKPAHSLLVVCGNPTSPYFQRCLRTGVSWIVKVAVEDCLSDLYSCARQLFGVMDEHGDILLTSGLCNVLIIIHARPLVRHEFPNGTNLYLRENPLSLAKDMSYTKRRFPSSFRTKLSSLSARAANIIAAAAVNRSLNSSLENRVNIWNDDAPVTMQRCLNS